MSQKIESKLIGRSKPLSCPLPPWNSSCDSGRFSYLDKLPDRRVWNRSPFVFYFSRTGRVELFRQQMIETQFSNKSNQEDSIRYDAIKNCLQHCGIQSELIQIRICIVFTFAGGVEMCPADNEMVFEATLSRE